METSQHPPLSLPPRPYDARTLSRLRYCGPVDEFVHDVHGRTARLPVSLRLVLAMRWNDGKGGNMSMGWSLEDSV